VDVGASIHLSKLTTSQYFQILVITVQSITFLRGSHFQCLPFTLHVSALIILFVERLRWIRWLFPLRRRVKTSLLVLIWLKWNIPLRYLVRRCYLIILVVVAIENLIKWRLVWSKDRHYYTRGFNLRSPSNNLIIAICRVHYWALQRFLFRSVREFKRIKLIIIVRVRILEETGLGDGGCGAFIIWRGLLLPHWIVFSKVEIKLRIGSSRTQLPHKHRLSEWINVGHWVISRDFVIRKIWFDILICFIFIRIGFKKSFTKV
jgi:hypothetical protein